MNIGCLTCGYSWGWCRVSWARWYVATVWIFGESSGSGRSGLPWQCSQGSIARRAGSSIGTGRKAEYPSGRSRSGRISDIGTENLDWINFLRTDVTNLFGSHQKSDDVFYGEPSHKDGLSCTKKVVFLMVISVSGLLLWKKTSDRLFSTEYSSVTYVGQWGRVKIDILNIYWTYWVVRVALSYTQQFSNSLDQVYLHQIFLPYTPEQGRKLYLQV